MRALKFLLFLVPALLVAAVLGADAQHPNKVVLVIHGGAGVPPHGKLTPKDDEAYRADLNQTLDEGYKVLSRGDSSLDAVEAAIRVMEDSPRFNAGKGAVFTHEGRNELDASIMDGKDRRAGAVAGVTRIKNPITAAREVMKDGKHVLLVGEGAERFAFSKGVKEVNPVYFWTEERWKELQDELDKEAGKKGSRRDERPRYELGTVGAVALDHDGNLAAGTSTGGLTNKRFGRVGDSPIIGAGTYADNRTCAVSCTGHGEVFIRYTVARDVAARMQYLREEVEKAAPHEVRVGLPKEEEGGVGGLIALDKHGHFAMEYNTVGMYRGYVTEGGTKHVLIYDR